MRWSDDGDEGADGGDGGDDVDDDPDDARRDGDDDGGDFLLREGISPAYFSLTEPFFFLSGFRLAEEADYFFEVYPEARNAKVCHDDIPWTTTSTTSTTSTNSTPDGTTTSTTSTMSATSAPNPKIPLSDVWPQP